MKFMNEIIKKLDFSNSEKKNAASSIEGNEELFLDEIVKFMVDKHNVEEELANNLIAFYLKDFKAEDATSQHLGPEDFAIQILQKEELI